FQAEDGIRDKLVTGVQTCALPIFRRLDRRALDGQPAQPALRSAHRAARLDSPRRGAERAVRRRVRARREARKLALPRGPLLALRSEERRVGKEWRSRGTPCTAD